MNCVPCEVALEGSTNNMGFLSLIVVIWFVYSLISHVRTKQRLSALEAAVSKLTGSSANQAKPTPALPSADLVAPPKSREPVISPPVLPVAQPIDGKTIASWSSKIGVVALLFGMAFFLKYAIDQGWVSIWTRIILGFGVGALMLVLSQIWEQRYQKYARVLAGGGLAILYATVFAAYQFYHLFSQDTGMLLTVVITVTGIILGYRRQSQNLAAIAWLGGYISPLLLASPAGSQVMLFVYLTVLNVGLLLSSIKYYWPALGFVSLLGTIVNYGLWYSSHGTVNNATNSAVFLLLNLFVLTLGHVLLYYTMHQRKTLQEHDGDALAILLATQAGFYGLALTVLLYHDFRSYLGLIWLLAAIIFFMGYAIVDRAEHKALNYVLSFAGTASALTACFWQFHAPTLHWYLLLLSLVLLGAGAVQKRIELRVWGVVALVYSTLVIVVTPYHGDYSFLWNDKFILEVAAVLGLLVARAIYGRVPTDSFEKDTRPFLIFAASVVVWLALSWEIVQYFSGPEQENSRNLSLSLWWLVYAVILGLLSWLRSAVVLRKAAVILFVLTILKVFLYDVQSLELGYRVVSFISLGVILLIVSFVYQKYKEKIHNFWQGQDKG